jgi:hypothetical protein
MSPYSELIMVQVKAIMTTSPYSPQNSFESMHSQVQDWKAMSETFFETFDAVSAMIPKRNRSQKRQRSFKKTKAEEQSKALSGLRVKGYSCSEAGSMSPKTES